MRRGIRFPTYRGLLSSPAVSTSQIRCSHDRWRRQDLAPITVEEDRSWPILFAYCCFCGQERLHLFFSSPCCTTWNHEIYGESSESFGYNGVLPSWLRKKPHSLLLPCTGIASGMIRSTLYSDYNRMEWKCWTSQSSYPISQCGV